MSTAPELRRADRAMTESEIAVFLGEARHGRLATIGGDGYPYCVPLLHAPKLVENECLIYLT